MSNTRKRLQELTAGLVVPTSGTSPTRTAPADGGGSDRATVETRFPPGPANGERDEAETRFPPALPGVHAARTGPGQMLAFRGQMIAADSEINQLKERLEQYKGALATRHLPPELVQPSRWANRHPASYESAAFNRLKEDIQNAGGNVQPILVKPSEQGGGRFEIIFGHRRHRACSELGFPVLATIWTEPLSDAELLAAMDRENRERADLSPYEQGLMYQRALDEHVYPSQRRLAEALGVSHTWVRKSLTVAQLPQAVIDCFQTPVDIQYRHGEQIMAALEADRKAVLKRAEKLRGKRLPPAAVLQLLVPRDAIDSEPIEIRCNNQVVGSYSLGAKGVLTIRLHAAAVADKTDEIIAALQSALAQET